MRRIGILGDSPAAEIYAAGARLLGWQATLGTDFDGLDVVVPAPIATTLARADSLVHAGSRHAFGWPLVTTAPVQELLRRAASVGPVTNLSSRSTRPAPAHTPPSFDAVLASAHDELALTLLVARLVGLGPPHSVEVIATTDPSVPHAVDLAVEFAGGLVATVHADWSASSVGIREFQLAGTEGVLRSETHPHLLLEFNGEAIDLPQTRIADEQRRALHESGVIGMLTTVGAALEAGSLPAAFTLEFGRDVLELVVAGSAAASTGRSVALPFSGDREIQVGG